MKPKDRVLVWAVIVGFFAVSIYAASRSAGHDDEDCYRDLGGSGNGYADCEPAGVPNRYQDYDRTDTFIDRE